MHPPPPPPPIQLGARCCTLHTWQRLGASMLGALGHVMHGRGADENGERHLTRRTVGQLHRRGLTRHVTQRR